MIAPHDLITLAERLAAASSEVERRAAVSRAYYGAFHVANWLIAMRCGVMLPAGPESHKKLQWCLEESGNAQLAGLGDRLRSLREERNRADYHLTDSRFSRLENVQAQLEIAKEIVSEIQKAEAKLAAFKSAIREYASSVLKLGVRN